MVENRFSSYPANLRKLFEDKFYDINHYDQHRRKNFSFSENHPNYFPSISGKLFDNGFRPHYPGNKDFAICFTHDIDIIYRWPTALEFARNAKHGRLNKIVKDAGVYLNPSKSLFNNVDKMLEHESRYGVKATYFFLSLTKGERDYNYSTRKIKHIFEQVKQNGSSIGLHGGHEASNSQSKIISEKQLLENALGYEVSGYRGHFLKFNYPDTWKYLENAGLKYDSTLSYPDIPGFRNGMCYPFRPVNTNTLLEYPLVIADHIFFDFMDTDFDTAFTLFETMMNRVKELKGVMVVLWHNHFYFDKYIELYDRILKLSSANNAWLTSLDTMNKWWVENKFTDSYSKYCPEIFG